MEDSIFDSNRLESVVKVVIKSYNKFTEKLQFFYNKPIYMCMIY